MDEKTIYDFYMERYGRNNTATFAIGVSGAGDDEIGEECQGTGICALLV